MADQLIPTNQNISLVVHEIGDLLAAARSNVARQVNNELLSTYWHIGRIIAEYEQTVPERADYGKQTLKELSKALTNEFGKGFSVSNIQFMRRFYQTYQIQQTASVKLSWSHYVLYIPNKKQLIAQVEAVLEKQKAIESNSTGI
jgi:hypothetical protein